MIKTTEAKARKKTSEIVVTVAEMLFSGKTQQQVADFFDVSQQRIASVTKTELFIKETAKLKQAEQLRELEQSQVLAQAQFQAQKCIDEFDAWLKQSKEMSSVNAATYAKIMKSINMALDSANADPDSPKSITKLKLIPNLARSATLLQQQIASELNQRLGVEEIAKRISQGEF